MTQGSYTTDPNIDDIDAAAATLLGDLNAHAATDTTGVHGQITVSPKTYTRDINRSIVARRLLYVTFQGSRYAIPADTNQTGPTQIPRFQTANMCPDTGTGSPRSDTARDCRIFDDAPSGSGGGTYGLNVIVTGGTLPMTFQWQHSLDQLTWVNFTAAVVDGPQGFKYQLTGSANGPISSLPVTITANFAIIHDDSSNKTADPLCYVRCLVSNADLEDGQAISSGILSIGCHDETGCWICSKVNDVQKMTPEECRLIEEFKKYCVEHHSRPAAFYLKGCKKLTQNMVAAGVDWAHYIGFEQSLFHLIRVGMLESAYILYRETVLAAIAKYWETCKHPAHTLMKAESDRDRKTNWPTA